MPKSKEPETPKSRSDHELDIAAQAEANEGIRQGLEDERNGRLRSARDFFAEFERTHQIPAYHA